ncbi:TrpF Phosphoribosylanthranilate isomerase [Flavobacteriaceae bacterium]
MDNLDVSAPSPLDCFDSRNDRAAVKIKICGMKFPENILEVGALLPDFMGFIFWEKSSRYFDGEIPMLPKSIKKVGVFVDESFEIIVSKIDKHKLNCIQLHGNETVEFCQKLKELPIEIIKVFSIKDNFDFEILKEFESVCDYFLFDTKGELPGGNGTTFDWNLLKKYPSNKPFFLSGGIGIEEIKLLKEMNLPIYGIDVNSKFEIEPGLKNTELLKSFQSQIEILNLKK